MKPHKTRRWQCIKCNHVWTFRVQMKQKGPRGMLYENRPVRCPKCGAAGLLGGPQEDEAQLARISSRNP
jgi:ribosomal protein S27AE